VVRLDDVDRTHVAVVGGKGAQLGALRRIGGVRVPDGFCVTTAAYRRVVAGLPAVDGLLDELARLGPEDREEVAALSARIRQHVERAGVPEEVERAIAGAVRELGGEDGDGVAWAVRSSATAEDLPSASFAGQHDSFLHVVDVQEVLRHVRRCWASLCTERAVVERVRNGIDQRDVAMAVVVQRMVVPHASGVLFTADPVTGHRRVASVEATFGLGEALVSGSVEPDRWVVRDGEIVDRTVATKRVAVHAAPVGGTREEPLAPERRTEPTLLDERVLDLVALGRRIEAHAGSPQDIEWCLDDDGFQVVQSRPITTLFPTPEADDGAAHVYVSVGHGQMMTEPMTPLGLSVWQMTSRAPMRVAGGRLFVDVTAMLSSSATRAGVFEAFRRSDPLIADALRTVLERGDLVPAVDAGGPDVATPPGGGPEPIDDDPAIVTGLIERNRASVAELRRAIRTRTGAELLDFIEADIDVLRGFLADPLSHRAAMAGIEATWWLNDTLQEWLGEPGRADVLSLAAPNNVTAEMGLALLDVADAVRPHPEVVARLGGAGDDHVLDDHVLDELAGVEGGAQARDAIVAYLDTYGMRCIGEIDIGRPRWRERPVALVPTILSNVAHFEPGERQRRTERGRERARHEEQELLHRLRALPDGAEKADRTERMVRRLRMFLGYREYPKYGMVSRYDAYRQALLAEARRLVDEGVLRAVDDIVFLAFHELRDVVRSGRVDHDLIARRRLDLRRFARLTPPRVLTSDGEVLHGAYRRDDVPAGALVGLAVSGGTVEGRARVVHDVGEADLEPGDILVTTGTDPSWSPLFVAIAGLVTEVGGLMTHGSVIAREYGLAAVVGVERATHLIRDGQRIRVDGTRGWVEIVGDAP
jgi:rifampicin phosphotransferase